MTLQQYLSNNRLTINQTYSLLLQICNIMLILYNGGYSHNDLHTGNIMVNVTNEKTFTFTTLNKKVPFYGLHITAIDYGEVLHKKFKIKYNHGYKNNIFLQNRKKHFFNELYCNIMLVINNFDKYIDDCKKMKHKLPWEHKINTYDNGIKMLINEQYDFYTKVRDKYINIYPKSKKLIYDVEENINNLPIKKIVKNNKNEYYFWEVIIRIVDEFQLTYPKIHAKYFKWCSYHKGNLPKQDILDIMLLTDGTKLIKYLLNKIKLSKN